MHITDTIKTILVPIHAEGYPFIGIFCLLTLILFFLYAPLGFIGFILTIWCIYFFRNPDRITPIGHDLVIAPADGVIQKIWHAKLPPELRKNLDDDEDDLDEDMLVISIFMNVFNVHVNRIPCDGNIISQYYHPGKFFNASLDKASTDNERHSVLMQDKDKRYIGFVQIAGLVARRILCDLKDEQEVKAGERYGIIRFGSRVDVYLPKDTIPLVCVDQLSVGGETILADFSSTAITEARQGEIR
jgi:phosphatidylserine decarboxylase